MCKHLEDYDNKQKLLKPFSSVFGAILQVKTELILSTLNHVFQLEIKFSSFSIF
jgi:hypothetical protein